MGETTCCSVYSDVGQRAEHKDLQAMQEAPLPPVHSCGLTPSWEKRLPGHHPGHRNSSAPFYLLLGRDDQLLRLLLHVPKIHTLKELNISFYITAIMHQNSIDKTLCKHGHCFQWLY